VINRLDAARSPTPELHWPTGDTPPPPLLSSLPSSPPQSAAQARRTQGKVSRMASREALSVYTCRQLDRLSEQAIEIAEEISLLRSTIQDQLPSTRSKVRKSRKQVGKFGALTTKDANRHINARKEKDHDTSVRKGRKMAPPSVLLTPTPAAEGAQIIDTPSRLPLSSVYYHNTDYL
jgi:hypothetical protein